MFPQPTHIPQVAQFESAPEVGEDQLVPEMALDVALLGRMKPQSTESELICDVRFGPRNSGGNRGIAKCFWPYDLSWDTNESVSTQQHC